MKNVIFGDRITVQTFRGFKGNIIGKLPDGRMVLFNRDSPYISTLAPDQSVDCSVNHVAEKYVIVDPIREPKLLEKEKAPTNEVEPVEREETTEIEEDRRFENLRRLSEEGGWETAIFARALIHIIEMFNALKTKPPKRSSQETNRLVEELVENPSSSDDFLQAASSFGLTQTHVKEQKAPKSEFLRYLDGHHEEKREVEAQISIRTEAFGTIADLPKDVRLLTVNQTRHLKADHLKGLDGYDDIDQFTAFFAKASALERKEYGNMFYASTGTRSWHKLHKVTVERFKD